MAAAEAQPGEDRLRHLPSAPRPHAVVGRLLVGHQHPDLRPRRARSPRSQRSMPTGSGVPDLERQHARRHAVHAASVRAARPSAPMTAGDPAAWLWISSARVFRRRHARGSASERADAPAQLVGPRRRVAQRAARADRGAGAAADAQVRLDDDAAAAAAAALERGVAADRLRPSSTSMQAAAADLLVAAVGADLLPVAGRTSASRTRRRSRAAAAPRRSALASSAAWK